MPSYQIVGAFYRPPAQLIINALPPGTPLYLRAEPTNQFDPNAVQVLVKTEDMSPWIYDALTEELAKKGLELLQILEQPEWHLGYIRKEIAKEMRECGAVKRNDDVPGKFQVDFAGKAQIQIED